LSAQQPPGSPNRPFRSDRPVGGGGGRFGGGGGAGGGGRFGDRGGDRGGFRRAYGGPGGPPGPAVDYKALVEFVARSIAEKPEQVEINSFERGHGTVAIKIKMADEDMGRLIGKAGRNIEALRTLVRVASLRERKRVFVDMANTR
jgi:predicted RNA-binding protein YlqC (UPF0109 family)